MTDHTELVKRLGIISRIEPECFLGEGNSMHEVAARSLEAIEALEARVEELELGPRYHHPDCNWWKWDWRYSWHKSDCNCKTVESPTDPSSETVEYAQTRGGKSE